MSSSLHRRVLLVGALLCFAAFLAWLALPLAGDKAPTFARYGVLGTPLGFLPEGWDTAAGPNAVFLGLLLLAQWAFLHPLRRAAFAAGPGRPRWQAVLAVAFAATLLCAAAVATLLEMPDAWKRVLNAMNAGGMWTALAAIWALWCGVFYVYFRGGDFLARSEAVVRALIRGSVLELLIAIPTHAVVYRRSTNECYCERGSYTGVVFGFAVLIWAFGPGLMLLYLRERQRRTPVLQRLCPRCGADLGAAPASPAACPKCGHTFGPAAASPPLPASR